MQKKLLPVILVIILLLAAGSVYYYMQKQTKMPVVQQALQAKNTTAFSSIQDALNKSLSLQCDFTDANKTHTVAYIKNGAIRAEVTSPTNPEENGSILVKNKTIYYWTAQKTGMMLAMPTISVTPVAETPVPQQNTETSLLASLEQYKKYCKVAVVASSLFIVPTDVKFTDETKLMQTMPTVSSENQQHAAVPTEYQQYLPK